MLIRADKLISEITPYSRNEIKKLISKGRVNFDGKKLERADQKLPSECEIFIDGKKYVYTLYSYIMMNKPKGVISSTKPSSLPSVIDILPSDMQRTGLFPAGRLDADTEGFALITNDGEFAHDILSPSHHVNKVYSVKLDELPDKNMIEKIESGIELADKEVCLPCRISNINETDKSLDITICEGKYHQIKRMFAAAGCHVKELKRIKIGGLFLDEKLKPGESRYITSKEKDSITIVEYDND